MKSNTYVRLAVLGVACVISSAVTVLLIVEYRFFKKEVAQVLELQQEYRTYLSAMKRILNAQETDSFDQDECAEEKKKEITEASDDALYEDNENKSQLTIVNREPAYLKRVTLDYIREQNLEFLLEQIDFDGMLAYTDQLLEHTNKPIIRKQTSRSARRRTPRIVRPARKQQKIPAFVSAERPHPDMQFSWPIEHNHFWLSSFFGPRKKPNGTWGFHQGIDMAAVRGTQVKAAGVGVVVEAGRTKGYGKTVVIAHGKKYKTRYAHLDTISVSIGQQVDRNTIIGRVGDTGFVRKKGKDASHLHFEVYVFNKRVNPIYYLM